MVHILRYAAIAAVCALSIWMTYNERARGAATIATPSLRRLHEIHGDTLDGATAVSDVRSILRWGSRYLTPDDSHGDPDTDNLDDDAHHPPDDDPHNAADDGQHGAGGHSGGEHPSLFEALSAIHIDIGTYSVLVIIGFIILIKQFLEALYAFTHESAFHGMIKKIEEELMIVGCSSFAFKVVMNTTSFSTNKWAYPLEFGEVLVPLIAFSYCFVGIFVVVVGLKQCFTWSRAHNLNVVELLDDYFAETKTWWFRIRWMPMNKSIEQLEFRIFHNIFCKTFKIKKGAFAFDEYVEKVFQRFVYELIEIRLLDWSYVTVLLFLNLARVHLHIHLSDCATDDDDCEAKRTVRMFTVIGKLSRVSYISHWCLALVTLSMVLSAAGFIIFFTTFLTLVQSRRLELAILRQHGLKSHNDYAQCIKVHQFKNIRGAKA